MLTELRVKNIALIDEAEVAFGPGLNILTGETGAGKSILLGSINLALGQKMSREMLRTGEAQALVELVFLVEKEEARAKLAGMEIELEDGQLVITRKLQDGRSSCRINGETRPLSQVKEVAALLLDIHGQHEHQSLLYADRQLAIVDAYGGAEVAKQKEKTAAAYEAWSALQKEWKEYSLDEAGRERELSLLRFEINEIDEAQLVAGEDEELENSYRRMANGQRIAEALGAADALAGGADGAGDLVGRALRALLQAAEIDEGVGNLVSTLSDADALLTDFHRDVADYLANLSYSERELFETEKRLDLLNHLKAKFGRTIDDVLAYRDAQQQKLEALENFEERKEACEKKREEAEAALKRAADELTKARKKSAGDFARKVREGLADLNFLASEFEVAFCSDGAFRRDGRDEVTFLISTNPGEPVRPLSGIASGGELSRIMLAIKALMADRDDTETLIFDEIDAGISGRTAQAVSEKLARIGRGRQVLCITHLAQIAAQADRHFEIAKEADGASTATRIRQLNEEESVTELARILGGAELTEAALANARELKEKASKGSTD